MVDTVAATFARRAIGLVKDQPQRYAQILDAAGVAPDILDDGSQRVSARAFGCIWAEVSRTIDDEFFGADSRRMKSGSFAFLCRGLLHERELGLAMDHCLRGFGLLLDDISAEVVRLDRLASVRVEAGRVAPRNLVFATELLVTMVFGIMCWLAGRRLPLRLVRFAFPRPAYAAEYRLWLSDTLVFDAAATEIVFDAEVLDLPVSATATTMGAFLESWPESVFVKYRDAAGWTSRVRRILKTLRYAEWPDIDELASRMHVAPATLQRRLGSEGTSYSVVKSEMRRELAIRLLRERNCPIQQVAEEAGYHEVSAFYRAFRQWTGRAPGDFRDDLQSS
ncbi:MAG TPA: AraC family transcriptional regulator [Burkholderiaceae bacterium]|nr:AraC family transcriptional regulator [Burkholderiaceae bacterium]